MSERTVVSLGTATPGRGFPVYGETVAATINEVDPTPDVRPRNTKGSTENVPWGQVLHSDIFPAVAETARDQNVGM